MKKSTVFGSICLVSGLFLGNTASAQSTTTTTTPNVEAAKTAVVKKDKSQKEDPAMTLNGEPATRTASPAEPLKQKKSRRVNTADIKPVDMSKMETAKPGEVPEKPQATGTPFGNNRPVAGQKTVESAPLKKPADLKPATEEKN